MNKQRTTMINSWLRLCLGLTLSLSWVLPGLTQTVIEQTVLVANDRNSRINLRSQPSVNSALLGYGLPDDQVTLLEFRKGSGNEPRVPWIRVKFVKSGDIGWIRGYFVKTDITILTANDPNARINLRQGPSISTGSLGYGLVGDRIRVLECETGPDQDRPPWINVQFLQSQAIGWIRGDFVIVPLTYC